MCRRGEGECYMTKNELLNLLTDIKDDEDIVLKIFEDQEVNYVDDVSQVVVQGKGEDLNYPKSFTLLV